MGRRPRQKETAGASAQNGERPAVLDSRYALRLQTRRARNPAWSLLPYLLASQGNVWCLPAPGPAGQLVSLSGCTSNRGKTREVGSFNRSATHPPPSVGLIVFPLHVFPQPFDLQVKTVAAPVKPAGLILAALNPPNRQRPQVAILPHGFAERLDDDVAPHVLFTVPTLYRVQAHRLP